ncbi:GGDEF domain-containing protein [Baekduia soli]|uniref:GGDEF domain-containing protein n=1 Tax=Baekduia soli TaxID=496014 RepID=UPI001651DE5F|nr:GGDEF domain-containing protein [Baekduia soli]
MPAVLARWFALMVGVASAMTGVSLLADLTPDAHRGVELVLTLCGALTAAVVGRFGRRRPAAWFVWFAVPAVVAMVSAGVYLSGDPGNPGASFFVAGAVYSAYFFPVRVAAAHLALAGLLLGAALVAIASPEAALDRWMFTMGIAVLIGWVISVLRDQLLDRAATDPLTGVLNRGAFTERLEHELRHVRAKGASLGLIYVDVDDFKRLNDTGGHSAGDAALREVAVVLNVAARGAGRVGRMGGDEFALVLPHADQRATERAAAEVQRRVRESGVGSTVSVGVATAPLHGDGDAALMLAADAALYAAKRSGRDRVVTAAPPTTLAA